VLRTALALTLTLATAANAAQSLGAPDLEPAAELVQLDEHARAQLDALCDELVASLEPKNSRQGVSGKFGARIGARAPSTPERVCEIFVVEGEVVVVAGKYAFAAFDPVNNWDPFGLSTKSLACTVGTAGCFGPQRQQTFNLQVWLFDPTTGQRVTGRPDPTGQLAGQIAGEATVATTEGLMKIQAAGGAVSLARAATQPGLASRIANWFGNIGKPKTPVITPPVKVPTAPAAKSTTTPKPPSAPKPPGEPTAPRGPATIVPNEFYDLDEAASVALKEPATVGERIGEIGAIKNPEVISKLEAAGYNPNDFSVVQYAATGNRSGNTYVITVFEAEGGVYVGPHVSSSNWK